MRQYFGGRNNNSITITTNIEESPSTLLARGCCQCHGCRGCRRCSCGQLIPAQIAALRLQLQLRRLWLLLLRRLLADHGRGVLRQDVRRNEALLHALLLLHAAVLEPDFDLQAKGKTSYSQVEHNIFINKQFKVYGYVIID